MKLQYDPLTMTIQDEERIRRASVDSYACNPTNDSESHALGRAMAAAIPMRNALEALIAAADREAAILKAGEAAGKSDKEINDELAEAIIDRVLGEEKAREAIKAARERK